MGFPKDSDNSQFCHVGQGPLLVPLMIHLNNNNIVQKNDDCLRDILKLPKMKFFNF